MLTGVLLAIAIVLALALMNMTACAAVAGVIKSNVHDQIARCERGDSYRSRAIRFSGLRRRQDPMIRMFAEMETLVLTGIGRGPPPSLLERLGFAALGILPAVIAVACLWQKWTVASIAGAVVGHANAFGYVPYRLRLPSDKFPIHKLGYPIVSALLWFSGVPSARYVAVAMPLVYTLFTFARSKVDMTPMCFVQSCGLPDANERLRACANKARPVS